MTRGTAAGFIVLLGALLGSCGGSTGPTAVDSPSPSPKPSFVAPPQTAQFVAALRQAGANAIAAQYLPPIYYPSVDVPAVHVVIDEAHIAAFEFPTTAEAEALAADTSPSGHRFGRGQYWWVSDPHFFRSDRLIVLYVGRSRPILDLLEHVLGPQFAGLP